MTARLILINGIPASGKTTLARAWCERHAARLPLALDIDTIRSMLGGWQHALHAAGMAARDVAVAATTAHLSSGRDVLIPQYLQRGDFIERLEETARATGAPFVEIALLTDPVVAQQRFADRAARASGADPHGALSTEMVTIARQFSAFLDARPRAVRIEAGPNVVDLLDDALALKTPPTVP